METNTVHIGTTRHLAAQLAPNSIHTIVTSPPYWGLRSYLPQDHSDKAEELGSEKTPDEYVANLVAIFRALRPALRDDGTLWLNLGDSYATNGASGPQGMTGERATRTFTAANLPAKAPADCKPKDLIGVPWLVALALRADGWYLRSDIIWAKKNCMPESVRDRPTRSHEYIFLLSKSARYYYDSDAIREPHADARVVGGKFVGSGGVNKDGWKPREKDGLARESVTMKNRQYDPRGRNKRDVWHQSSKPYPEAHYATFPPDLIRPCVLAGTSEHGCCANCGAPYRRVVERKATDWDGSRYGERAVGATGGAISGGTARSTLGSSNGKLTAKYETTGWQPSCNCNAAIVPCVVLDPFIGSGTVAQVAVEEGRDWIGFDIDARSVGFTARRLAKIAPREVAAD